MERACFDLVLRPKLLEKYCFLCTGGLSLRPLLGIRTPRCFFLCFLFLLFSAGISFICLFWRPLLPLPEGGESFSSLDDSKDCFKSDSSSISTQPISGLLDDEVKLATNVQHQTRLAAKISTQPIPGLLNDEELRKCSTRDRPLQIPTLGNQSIHRVRTFGR